VLYAILVCTDGACEIAYEAWGEASELQALTCEECGRPLRVEAYANADRDGAAPRSAELRQRDAA
jgi:hypothetical protein